jgi:hypothetical protein
MIKKVGGILYENGKVLIGLKNKRNIRRMSWFFPYTLIPEGKSPKQTLMQFFEDQLGLEVNVLSHIMDYVPSEDPEYVIHLYKVRTKTGLLKRGNSFFDTRWIEPRNTAKFFTVSTPYALSQYLGRISKSL